MNRMNCMAAEIKPISKNVNLVGTAFTVKSMVGGNWGTHKALTTIGERQVLVVDARGYVGTAVWGLLQSRAALLRKVAGVIIDGAIRDSVEISRMPLTVFCRAVTPAGPHKGWKDEVNVPIQCAGVAVHPGDYVKGDDDGVVVIPSGSIERVIEEARKRQAQEEEWFRNLKNGMSSFECLGLHD
jgi:regulator of RNase E activity RraA